MPALLLFGLLVAQAPDPAAAPGAAEPLSIPSAASAPRMEIPSDLGPPSAADSEAADTQPESAGGPPAAAPAAQAAPSAPASPPATLPATPSAPATPPPTLPSVPSVEPRPPARLEPMAQPELPPARLPDTASKQAAPLEPAGGETAQSSPQDLVADGLNLPPQSALAGRPLALASALSAAVDRRRQQEVIDAYWRLAEAVAVYRYCLDYDTAVAEMPGADAEPALRAARAASAALLRDAEVAALAAQYDLAAAARLSTEAPLPLPADPPHAGPYRTYFSRLYPLGNGPARTALIDKTLPVRLQAIARRADAVRAADRACQAASEAASAGQAGADEVLAALRQRLQQQRLLWESVGRYNRDIAEYALAVARPEASGQALVAMLIEPAAKPLRPTPATADSGVAPAVHTEPATAAPTGPRAGQPTLADPRTRPGAGGAQETVAPAAGWAPAAAGTLVPAMAPPRDDRASASQDDSAGAATAAPAEGAPATAPAVEPPGAPAVLPKRPVVPVDPLSPGGGQSAAAPEAESTTAADAESTTTTGPQSAILSDPLRMTLRKPTAEIAPEATPPADEPVLVTPMYPALAGAGPARQARQLALTLHWNRVVPEAGGRPLTLTDALREAAGNRRDVIAAYWRARQLAAEYQVLVEQVQWLEELAVAPAAEGRAVPDDLELLRRAAEAARDEARASLLEGQYDLAVLLGRGDERPWPLPSTVPHAGGYVLKTESLPQSLSQSWPVRRLVATIPGLGESVRQHAAAVVAADSARAAASDAYLRGAGDALAVVARQTDATLAFLRALTLYNQAIADYALTVAPADTPADKLAATLVVEP